MVTCVQPVAAGGSGPVTNPGVVLVRSSYPSLATCMQVSEALKQTAGGQGLTTETS